MRQFIFLFLFAGMMTACTADPERKTREEVIAVVENYAGEQIEFPQRSVDRDGIITLQNNGIIYRIDPEKIIFGDIDSNPPDDAIATVTVSRMPIIDTDEHIVLINKDNQFIVSAIIDSGIRILSIENGIISVETSIVSPDSPMYGCESCREVIHYQYINGSIAKIGQPL